MVTAERFLKMLIYSDAYITMEDNDAGLFRELLQIIIHALVFATCFSVVFTSVWWVLSNL